MNETWQLINAAVGTSQLAQIAVPAVPSSVSAAASAVTTPVEKLISQTSTTVGSFLPSLLGAVGFLFIGWIVALVISTVVRGLLKRTDLDNRLGSMATGGSSKSNLNTEKIGGDLAFWLVFLFAISGALSALKLDSAALPLTNVLTQVTTFIPKLALAAAVAAVAWLLATAIRTIVTRTAGTIMPVMSRRMAVGENQVLPSETLGNVLYWLVFLFFLPVILDILELQGLLVPVQNLLDDILRALPSIAKAGGFLAVGWFGGNIIRELVTNVLAAAGTERLATKIGLNKAAPGQSLSGLMATVVYAMVLIVATTAALEALQIPSISGPASKMLGSIFIAIPQVLLAAAILAIAYVVSQVVGELVRNLLNGLGFDNIFQTLGLNTLHNSTTATPPTPVVPPTTRSAITPVVKKQTPSEVGGFVAQVGVMLAAAVTATGILGIPGLTELVSGLLQISGQVLSGVVVFAIGLYLANLAQKVVASSGTHQSQVLGQIARLAIITFVGAMALQQMGIAASIVNLAFGLLLGAVAVAMAISFGLGGRDVASEQLRDWMSGFRDKR